MTDKLNAGEVFRPKAFPIHTYVDRVGKRNGDTYEARLNRALRITGSLIVISGPSKSGKTVLCHRSVPQEQLVELSGAQIFSRDDFWNQIAEKLRLPSELKLTDSWQEGDDSTQSVSGSINVPLLADIRLNIGSGAKNVKSANTVTTVPRSNTAIMKYLIDNDKVLVIDDFHYMEPEVQKYIARTLKTELFNGLKAILLSLPHRYDDAVRLNPDLIGRTVFIDIAPWKIDELAEIAQKGFELLGLDVTAADVGLMAQESIASPQLMQENCLNLADRLLFADNTAADRKNVEQAFGDTVDSYEHYNYVLGQVIQGPPQGRNKRKRYRLKMGLAVNIYELILRGISIDPPTTYLTIEEIKSRLRQILTDDETLPNTLTISNSVANIEKIMKKHVPQLDNVEWKDQTLYILDPFLLFYLRWSDFFR